LIECKFIVNAQRDSCGEMLMEDIMYYGNYLAEKLRAASLGAENHQFLRNHKLFENPGYTRAFRNQNDFKGN